MPVSPEEKKRLQEEFMAFVAASAKNPNGIRAPEQKKARVLPPPVSASSAPKVPLAQQRTPSVASASSGQPQASAGNRAALIAAFEGSGAGSIRVGPLNELIRALYPSQADKDGSVKVISVLSPEFGIPGALRMSSSASECDCLIHSFLTVTCPNFRKLTQRSKDEFASIFRRQMLPRLVSRYPVTEKTPNQIMQFIIDVIQSGRFLSDADSSIIAKLFDVNLLLLEPAREGQKSLAILISPRNDNKSDPYVIYGSGAHFEGVKLDGDRWQRNYNETVQSVADIMAGRHAAFHGEDSFSFGSRVMYKGKGYYVVDRLLNPDTHECDFYYLSQDSVLMTTISEIGLSEGTLAALSERFTVATADDVTMSKGGYKKITRRARNNRRRKTRKFNSRT